MSKLFKSVFDSDIIINVDYNGYYLQKGNDINSAKDLINNVIVRRCIQIESHLLTWPDKTIYAVLTDDSFELFNGNHQRAFNNCDRLKNKFKGVYRIKSVLPEGLLQLVGVNVWGNPFDNHQYSFLNDNNLIQFKVS